MRVHDAPGPISTNSRTPSRYAASITAGKSMVSSACARMASAALSSVDFVGPAEGGAVKTHIGGRRSRQKVQPAVRLRDLTHDGAMDRARLRQRQRRTAEPPADLRHGRPVAADDALARRVDDEQVGPFDAGQRRRGPPRRPVHDEAGRPFDRRIRRQFPRLAGGVATAGQVAGEQRRGVHRLQHGVAAGPGPQGEQRRRLAETVADRRVGVDAEQSHEVRGQAAERHLAEDLLPGVGGPRRRIVPEDRRYELATQTLVFGVLSPQHFRPLHGQLAAHAGIVVARSRIDEGDFARPAQRPRREEHPVAERRRRGRPVRRGRAAPSRSAPRSSARSWATKATANGSFGDPGWSRNQARASASMPWSRRVQPGAQALQPLRQRGGVAALDDEQRLVAGAQRLPAVGAILASRRRSHSSSTTCTRPPSPSEQRPPRGAGRRCGRAASSGRRGPSAGGRICRCRHRTAFTSAAMPDAAPARPTSRPRRPGSVSAAAGSLRPGPPRRS